MTDLLNLKSQLISWLFSFGKWQDNKKAADFLKGYSLVSDGPVSVPIPAGLGRVIRPDGTVVNVNFARIIPNGDGTFKTAYPVIGKLRN